MHKLSESILSPTASSAPTRFSLVLLEPGEIYFEDYLVYYHELRCPFVDVEVPVDNESSSDGAVSSVSQPIKGNLKICSKSVVFDPINFSYPLVKFSYKSIDRIELFNDDSSASADDYDEDDLYTIRPAASKRKNDKRQKCFAISCKQTVNCKVNMTPNISVKKTLAFECFF